MTGMKVPTGVVQGGAQGQTLARGGELLPMQYAVNPHFNSALDTYAHAAPSPIDVARSETMRAYRVDYPAQSADPFIVRRGEDTVAEFRVGDALISGGVSVFLTTPADRAAVMRAVRADPMWAELGMTPLSITVAPWIADPGIVNDDPSYFGARVSKAFVPDDMREVARAAEGRRIMLDGDVPPLLARRLTEHLSTLRADTQVSDIIIRDGANYHAIGRGIFRTAELMARKRAADAARGRGSNPQKQLNSLVTKLVDGCRKIKERSQAEAERYWWSIYTNTRLRTLTLQVFNGDANCYERRALYLRLIALGALNDPLSGTLYCFYTTHIHPMSFIVRNSIFCFCLDSFFDFTSYVAEHHHDPLMRFAACRFHQEALLESGDQFHSSEEREQYKRIIRSLERACADEHPVIAAHATRTLLILDERKQYVMSEDIDFCGRGGMAVESPEFGISTYVYGNRFDRSGMDHLWQDLDRGLAEAEMRTMALNEIAPIHSLADFQPDTSRRGAIMAEKYARLKEMIAGASGDAAHIMERFLSKGDPLIVLQLLDRPLLLQGHHRLAALYKAARDGVVPAAWLERIPVKVIRYGGDMPLVLVQRILTLGNDLTWADLFPPQNG